MMLLQIFVVCAGFVLLAQPALADETLSGILQCNIRAGVGVPLGAYRNVSCAYKRPDLPIEQYEGFTGVITTATPGPQVVTFEVITPEPDALAALAGDYDQNLFGSPAITRPALNSLLGGRYRRIILKSVENSATTNLALLGFAIGVTPLHLNYAGVLSHRVGGSTARRARAEDR